MSNIKIDEEIDLYERYLFAENKEEVIKSLVVNSNSYFYIKLMNDLNKYGVENLPKESQLE